MKYAVLLSLSVCMALNSRIMAEDGVEYRLATDDTALQLRRVGDQICFTRLAPAKGQWNWIDGFQPFKPSIPLMVDGAAQPIDWKLTGFDQKQEGPTSTITAQYTADKPKLSLLVTWTAHPGPGAIKQQIRVTSAASDRVFLGSMPSLAIKLRRRPGAELQHVWVEKGAGQPTDAGTHVTTIGDNFHERQISSPRAARYFSGEMIPWLCIQNVTDQHGLYAAVATSAHVAQEVSAKETPGALAVSMGLDELVDATPFRTELKPGATFALPLAFFGCYVGDVDDGCNRLHRWGEKWLLAFDPRTPLVDNCSWGNAMNINEAVCKKMIDVDAELGVEMYHVDAGWYREMGLWRTDEKKFPNGIREISDYCHSKKMKFGLWVAWAQGGNVPVGPEGLCVYDKTRINWFPHDMPADWKLFRPWIGQTVCFGSPDARQWCLDELRRIVRDDGVDMLEHDQQVITWDCTRGDHEHTDSMVDAGLSAANGYYSIYDSLKKDFPELLLEDCVDGGETIDFGILQRCNYVSITDHYDPISNRRAFYDASFPFPPRMLEAYCGKNPHKTVNGFNYILRSGMLGWFSIMIDTAKLGPAELAATKRQCEIYKERLRPMIRTGNLYHVGDRPSENGWDAMQYVAAEGNKSIAIVFRAKAKETEKTIKLKGLSPQASYDVTLEDDAKFSENKLGKELMREGVTIKLPEMESSAIVYLKRK